MLAKRYNVVQMRQFFSSKSCVRLLSLPMRGEWIEMSLSSAVTTGAGSLPMRGEWIEILWAKVLTDPSGSLPMRGEWIEILLKNQRRPATAVSPHAGRVD